MRNNMILAVPFSWAVTFLLTITAPSAVKAKEMGTGTATPTQQAGVTAVSRAVTAGGLSNGLALDSGVCEARTINHITHILPQSCLTSSWASSRSATVEEPTASSDAHASPQLAAGPATMKPTTTATHALSELEPSVADAAATAFMSFEDWKEMMLRRAGQDPQALRYRKLSQYQADHQYPQDMSQAGLGEEDEILLNFDHYPRSEDGARAGVAVTHSADTDGIADEPHAYGDGRTATTHRSKDAGKTCKERFSYSSFDAGATVLKAAAGAKNARAILIENKDTYMLLECAAASRYVIVELSDDILIDTVVLANFEFFSSMFRHFRVAVSDRYPVKGDKWRELGVFEARNSRDIQPFLVENPQIWAKYLRVEFLTHYGNEYYCPISLLRVHGSRMLDSWKDSETGRDDDAQIDGHDSSVGLGRVESAPASAVDPSRERPAEGHIEALTTSPPGPTLLASLVTTCPASEGPSSRRRTSIEASSSPTDTAGRQDPPASGSAPAAIASTLTASARLTPSSHTGPPAGMPSTWALNSTAALHENYNSHSTTGNVAVTDPITVSVRGGERNASTPVSSPTRPSASSSSTGKARVGGTSAAAAASPTVQEGFFNVITKRLQQVESNLTLSLKYVEEQSRHVQEALQRGEQKQHLKVTAFLDRLNQTLLAELRSIREQYDQIWQSTVLALESQADRSDRDMMALSTRLNVLADEVVFQKRMAIVQAVILLSCLFLVIFSRSVALPSLSFPSDHVGEGSYMTHSTPRHDVYLTRHRDDSSVAATCNGINQPHAFPPTETKLTRVYSAPTDVELTVSAADSQAPLSGYRRLSPPLTPVLVLDDGDSSSPRHTTSSNNAAVHDACTMSNACHSLRLTLATSRKPLPSLPEHPSSPPES